MENEKNKAEKTGKPVVKRMVLAILAVIILAALFVIGRFLYIMYIDPMSAFERPAPTLTPVLTPTPLPTAVQPTPTALAASPAATPLPIETPLPEETVTPADELSFMENRVNILLLGWDQSPERDDETSELYRDEQNNFRSDVLMLLTVDFAADKVDLISIPRDSYAPLYNDKGEQVFVNSHYKLNAAFAKGGSAEGECGFKYAMNTVGKLLGVPIEHYAGVDMQGLKAVVDAIGGVDYDVDVRIVLNGRVLEKGYQHLDGQQVLDYCRARKGISTDAGRNDRQQRMLFAIFNKLRDNGQLSDIVKIYKSVRGYVYTNLSTDQMAALAAVGMDMHLEDLKRHLPVGEYVSSTPYTHAVYYLIDNQELKVLVKSIFGIVIETQPRYDIGYVKADIVADDMQEYIGMADYLLTHEAVSMLDSEGRAAASPTRELIELALYRDRLYKLTHRAEGEDADIPFDISAMEAARDELTGAMGALCARFELTKKDVNKSKLPKDVYEALPAKPVEADA